MQEYTDQLGRRLQLPALLKRIVSLVPSQTELLVDLGLKPSLVGITKFCVHPVGLLKEKKIVGGTKQVHFDRIAALEPDIILCNKEENTEEMVLELEKIAPVHVSEIEDIEGSLELIRQYREIFGVKQEASKIEQSIKKEQEKFQEFIKDKPEKKVAYFIWQKPYMVAGKNTFIDYLLRLNKFENIYAQEHTRYPQIGLSTVRERKADLVLLSTEPFPFKDKHKEAFQKKLPEQRVEIVDGEYFSWYGSRLVKAFDYFEKLRLSLPDS